MDKIEPEEIKEEIEELKEKIDERRVQYGYEELNACGCTCKEDCAISAVIKINRLGNYCEPCQKCISKELASVFKRHKKGVAKPEFHEGEKR